MLKKIFKSKLNLKKETVTTLNKDQMNKIVGGLDTRGCAGGTPMDAVDTRAKATADSIAAI